MEKDYEKIEKLIKLRREYAARVAPVEQSIEKERKSYSPEDQDFMAAEWLSRRFDAGLFSLQVCQFHFANVSYSKLTFAQTIDVILAWLIAEDDGAKKKVVSLLADRDEDLSLIRGTLKGKSPKFTARLHEF